MHITAKSKFSIFKLRSEGNTIDELIAELQTRGYTEEHVPDTEKRLFIHKGEQRQPKWVAFLMQICESNELESLMKRMPSFVLLYSMEQAHYAVTGGAGHCHIKRYIEEDFGLDTICRVLEPDNIKSLRQTALAGKVQQLERIFKESYNYN